jgi:hypothetical protein
MGKVIKNVVKILVAAFCGLLLAVLVLPLLVSLLVSVPAIQRAAVGRITERFSERLGVRVSVDRVALRLFNQIEAEGFYVGDFDGDTLLYVPRLAAPIEDPGLGRGHQLTFGRVRLSGARLYLRKARPEDLMNISRLVDSISPGPPNPDSRFRMRIAAIEADSLTFGLWRGDRERREAGVDFTRFVMRDVSTRIEDFAISGDTIRMDINSLGGVERTGLVIDNLEAYPLIVSRAAVTLSRVAIRAAGSRLDVPWIRLVGGNGEWDDFSEFSDRVDMSISVRSSRVTSDLVGAFAPAVAGWGIALDDVSLDTRGVLSRFEGTIDNARTQGTTLALDFTSRGLPHYREAEYNIRLRELKSTGNDVATLAHSITGREPGRELTALLSRLGWLSMRGEVRGGLSDFDSTASISTGAGGAGVRARATSGEAGVKIDGRVTTPYFEIGELLAVEDLGPLEGLLTTVVDLPVRRGIPGIPGRSMAASIHGEIKRLGFRGYTYSGLAFDATLEGKKYGLTATVRDPALEADISANLDRSGNIPRYGVDLMVGKMDLAATGLDRDDSVSLASGRLTARISGRGLDDANGAIELVDAAYRSAGGRVATPRATLTARSDGTGKLLTLNSEFADAEFRSRTGYRDMLAYLGGFLQRYIPLPGFGEAARSLTPPDGGDPAAASNYSIATVNVKNTERLFDALSPGTAIAEGSEARFMFNPYTGSFSLSAGGRFFEHGGLLAADPTVTADNAADSLTVHLSGSDIWSRRGHVSRFELHGGARGGRARVDAALDGKVWRLAADSVGFSAGRMGLRGLAFFATDTPGRRLTASGVVSARQTDTLRVHLNRFDLAPLGRLARGGVDIGGLATGWLDVAGVLSTPEIEADIALGDLSAGGYKAPPMRFVSASRPGGGVSFSLVNEATGDGLIRGTLSAKGEIDARARLEDMDGGLLDALPGGILENTVGKASAGVMVSGTLRAPRLDGHIDVESLATTVGYTRARYSVEGVRLNLENSILTLPRTPVSSGVGGRGDLTMKVDLRNFRDITVDLEARTEAMLVFDTRPADSEAYYGRVFATGSARIRSGRLATTMDISARTDPGTRFHLPLNAKSNVSWADFVVFARPGRGVVDSTDVLARKRLAYERRLGTGSAAAAARRRKPLELNLTASITPSAEVHMLIDPNLGEGITARGEGVIDMRINPASDIFTMTGDYNIESGRFEFSMMNVFNKTFDIAPGSSLRWSGAPEDAMLSVDATYRTRTSLLPLVGEGSSLVSGRPVPVECIIRLRERLSDPEITFDIALPGAEAEQRQLVAGAMTAPELKSMQFLSLLTTGSFATDNSITGQAANAGMSTTGAVGFDILTNQLNNFLSSDDYDVYFRYRPQDGFATNQVDVGFSTGFWDDRIQLEIEGNYVDNRAATTATTRAASDLAGDVSLTWVIDAAGNLRLKAFSRTIDRPGEAENQGLQESGVGIHYKRDFNSMGDIFRRKRVKFAPDSVNTNK